MVAIVTRAGKGSPLTNTELDANFNNLNNAIVAGGVNGYVRTNFTATAGQTSFNFTYTPPYVLVWVNGVLLATADYTATSGTTVVLSVSCVVGDIVELVALSSSGGGGGTVTAVTGTAPVVSSGGTTPAISMAAATASVNGYLTSTDWTTFNSKQALLVSGTNIKTLFGTTILGSGDAGLVPVAYGGTGLSAPGASGNVLTSNGTGWVSSAPSAGAVTSVAGRTGAVVLTSADSSYTGSGSGATALTVQSKLNQVVNVKDYGATGDGTTNDTTAIQNAINASGGIIYFPAGTYSVTALTLAAGKQLVGENRETSVIRLRTALNGSGMINATNASHIVAESLTLNGNSLAGTKDSLLNFYGCHYARVENCNFINVDQFALGCNSMSYWVARNNKFLMTQRVGAWIRQSTVVSGSGGPANASGLVGTISAPTGSNPIQAAFTYSTNASGGVIASSIVFSTNGRGYIANPTASFPAVPGSSCSAFYGGAQVVAITGSASALVGEGIEVSHNYFEGGGTNFAVQNSNIFNNFSCRVIYGASFVSEQAANVGRNNYYNNTVTQVGYCTIAGTPYVNTYIGADTDDTVGSGFELWGAYENCHDNLVYYNASNGIAFGCRGGICANNIVYDNGQYYASIGNYNTYGIKATAGNITYNGSYSVIQGNRSFDQNGASGKQGYGIGIENSSVVGVKIVDNDCSGNRTSDYNMNSATPSVLRDILSTGGGGGTVTGVTATAPVVSSGGTAPVISMAAATTSVNGYLTSTDWTTFNNKASAGANSTITSLSGLTTALSASQGGTGLTAPGALNNVLTSNGAGAWVSQAPSGGGAVASFSAGTTGLTPSTATTGAITLAGTLAVANGGTGQTTYTNGQLLIGNTTGGTLAKATLTQGAGISITNGAGSITIASTATGTVTGVTGTAPIVSSGGTAPVISISAATTAAAGSMSAADKTKIDALSNGAVLFATQAFPGATISAGGIGAQGATLAGVVFGDFIEVGFSFPLQNCTAMGFVTAANGVQCIFTNNTGASVTLASGSVYFRATKR